MYRNGREDDQVFAPNEGLYRRYRLEHWTGGQLNASGLRFPKQSVNRSKYGEPEDVLFSTAGAYNGWGVVEFRVDEIPERLEVGAAQPYVFYARHVPDDSEPNYAHSEIWSALESRRMEFKEPTSKAVQKEFRDQLCQKIRENRIRIRAFR